MSQIRKASAVPPKRHGHGPKIAVVTGASRGLGFALARRLLNDGFIVICAQRTPSTLQPTHTNALNAVLDLSQEHSVEMFSQRMFDELPHIDILINNAAICVEDCLLHDVHPPWKKVMQVNFFAQVQLTERLLPLLEASTSFPRVVNISSGDGELVFFAPKLRDMLLELKKQRSVPYLVAMLSQFVSETLDNNSACDQEFVFDVQPAYRLSKATLNCYTCVAALRAQETNSCVSFLSICPGDVDTSMCDPSATVVTPEEAVSKMENVFDLGTKCETGKFLRYDSEIDW